MEHALNPLVRSSTDRLLAGVCGGIARWLGWSPLAVRILAAVLALASAVLPGAIAYLVLWLVMPADDARSRAAG
jgi:phage shock protein C